jgi:hypothetical protein
MKILSVFAIALTVSLAASASAQGLESMREQTQAQIDSILGSETSGRIAPVVSDAQSRIEAAIKSVASTDKPPREILTFSQKLAAMRALQAHERPDLDLTDDQKAQLATFARDVVKNVLPIVADDGAKIDAQLSPDQRKRLGDLRARSVDALAAHVSGEGAGFLPFDPQTILDRNRSAGAFVLALALNPRAMIGR